MGAGRTLAMRPTDDTHAADSATASGSSPRPEPTKLLTVMLPDDLVKKLKVIALVRETSISELLAEAAAGVVKRELKKALSKISGE